MRNPGLSPQTALVADIGGTNARFAVADLETLRLSDISHFPCASHSSLASAIGAYLGGLADRPAHASIAVAAPIAPSEIQLTNSPWRFTREELCREAGLDGLLLLNDFQALALSLPHLGGDELHQIGGGEAAPNGTKVVLGAGTGIGVAGLVWSPSGWVAVPGEGGHISLAAHTAREFALIEALATAHGRASVERVLSGPGLADLYCVVAASHGASAEQLQPNEVLTRALANTDQIAVETLDLFINWFGRFAGDAALMFGAQGGVYLGGGIAPKIRDALSSGAFREAFESKGRMRGLLAPIPLYVILAEFAALTGAAAALRAALEQDKGLNCH